MARRGPGKTRRVVVHAVEGTLRKAFLDDGMEGRAF